MKATIRDLEGSESGEMDLPDVFDTPHRPDLIKRAVLAYQSARRQKYGRNPKSGERTSAHYEGRRHQRPEVQMMNREMSRMPRLHGDTAGGVFMQGRLVAQAVGGRKAHGPKSEKEWEKEINDKERKLAIRSAVASTADEDSVRERNHKFDTEVPLVVSDDIQSVSGTKELKEILVSLGLGEDLGRASRRKMRAGKGRSRGRKYRNPVGPLIVAVENDGIVRAASNIPGVDVVHVDELNAEHLSPGAHGTRLTVWTESAAERIGERYGD